MGGEYVGEPGSQFPPRGVTPPLRCRHVALRHQWRRDMWPSGCPYGPRLCAPKSGRSNLQLGHPNPHPKFIFDDFWIVFRAESVFRVRLTRNVLNTPKIGVDMSLTTRSSNTGIRVTTLAVRSLDEMEYRYADLSSGTKLQVSVLSSWNFPTRELNFSVLYGVLVLKNRFRYDNT